MRGGKWENDIPTMSFYQMGGLDWLGNFPKFMNDTVRIETRISHLRETRDGRVSKNMEKKAL